MLGQHFEKRGGKHRIIISTHADGKVDMTQVRQFAAQNECKNDNSILMELMLLPQNFTGAFFIVLILRFQTCEQGTQFPYGR